MHKDDSVYIGQIDKNSKPNKMGHIMIDLKRNVPVLVDITIDEGSVFVMIIEEVCNVIIETEKAEHIYSPGFGNSVRFPLTHLLSGFPNTPEAYSGQIAVYGWEVAPIGDISNVTNLCTRTNTYVEKYEHE